MYVKDYLRKGRDIKTAARKEEGKAKLGKLRGGSVGAIIDGDVYGTCHRIAHLRSIGLEEPVEDNTKLMFAYGFANEVIVEEELKASLPAGHRVEVDVDVTLPVGDTEIQGHLDLVLYGEDDKPYHFIELKSINSIYTAKSVHYELKPKTTNLLQAAFYKLALEKKYGLAEGAIGCSLLYVSRGYYHTSMLSKTFKTLLMNKPWDVDFKEDNPFRMLPFEREYTLKFVDGYLTYDTEGLRAAKITNARAEDILNYYQAVYDMKEHKDLGPRPVDKDLLGRRSYSPCSYCVFSDTCDKSEDNYDEWLDNIKMDIETLTNERS